ncbi:MAG: DUF362 domain-containing protein [Muribaculaceae bacterium]|nr:DUF362 domain-containing protein [Muribaculaceae bacterium]
MKKTVFTLGCAAMLALSSCGGAKAGSQAADTETADSAVSKVYLIKDITPENLVRIYEALGKKADGANVAVKISTGESAKSNQLDTALIKPLVQLVNGTIVECNTAYEGNRNTTEKHLKTAADHGYTAIAKVDIMDADGDTLLPVSNGRHLEHDIVGRHYTDYDFTVVLSHFKGHAMGGFGGALKNISIGIASSDGKAYIHSAGKCSDAAEIWKNIAEQDDFLESMGEACQAVINHAGGNILYINVANNLSVDCDCDGDPDAPQMGDIGILASLDPVALDRACVDLVFNSDDPGKEHLIERINSRHGTHLLDYSEQLGLGSQTYELITLE